MTVAKFARPSGALHTPPSVIELRHFLDELNKLHVAFILTVQQLEQDCNWAHPLTGEWLTRFGDLQHGHVSKCLEAVWDEHARAERQRENGAAEKGGE
jgi:hypothetical protein